MEQQLFVTMALQGWNTHVARAEKYFDALSDTDFQKTIAPGKNRIIYLYGHLTSYHDLLIETLGIGEALYPELTPAFLRTPDGPGVDAYTVGELKQYWVDVHSRLSQLFAALPAEDWFKRHNAMTDEDFAKDPTRNRLSVLLSRTNHIAYHFGQLVLV
ncbi:DinB family protein [Mucilaginibacter psychrotolerans]|uniref:DinB family protein n=1 Tax=Mucilaginibacter psychrotolerans TaxID=1524096 RepID=A0A4Y8SKF2_9SPHI|nr:DinB family protein [Mucilaginibacter psychrotolerans]TFF39140.1 DinB family protein [Mucilaginibacter psychrotolerans]